MRKYKVLFVDDVIDGKYVCDIYMESDNYKLVDGIAHAYCEEMERKGKKLFREITDVTDGDIPGKSKIMTGYGEYGGYHQN